MTIHQIILEKRNVSPDGNQEKFIFRLQDNLRISSVLMKYSVPGRKNRNVLSISSQVGCQLDCKFCESGQMGIIRNLSVTEIIDQYLLLYKLKNEPVTRIEFGGMGEPMLNYEHVVEACHKLRNDSTKNLQFLIVTSGIVPGIERLTLEKYDFDLSISLNATTDEIRNRIMPVNQKYPLASVFQAAKEYARQTRKPVTFKYMMLSEVNDTIDDAKRLKLFTQDIPCEIEVFPYVSNKTSDFTNDRKGTLFSFKRPDHERLIAFVNALYSEN